MDRGYLKLWRKSLDSEVFASESLWRLWSWCLMKTTHKTRHAPMSTGKGEVVVVTNPGQFVFGRNRAADALGWSPSTVWKRMIKLEEIGCISIQSNSQYSIVSICNWDDYQAEETKKEQASDKQVTSKEQPSDSQVTTKELPSDTDKNVKNVKNVKNKKRDEFDPHSVRPVFISEKTWDDLISHRKHKKAANTQRAFESLITEFDKARQLGFTPDECVDKMCQRNWTGFDAAWMDNKPQQKGQPETFAEIKDRKIRQAMKDFVGEN